MLLPSLAASAGSKPVAKRWPWTAVLIGMIAAPVGGCVGDIGDRDGANEQDGDDTTGTTMGEAAWTTRRLTKEQYGYTVLDVLGVELGAALDALPDEARTEGFTNSAVGLVVTDDHVDGYFELAELIGESVDATSLADRYAPCTTLGDATCHAGFVGSLGLFLFRRPLDEREVSGFAGLFDTAKDEDLAFGDGVRLVVEAMLQAPQFLYLLEDETVHEAGIRTVTGYEMASRLSFVLWQSSPDQALYDAAESGLLDTSEGILSEAERMMTDPKGKRASARFVRDWLILDSLEDTEREDLSNEMAQALLMSTVETYQEHIAAGRPLENLLDSQVTVVPDFVATWYGLSPNGNAPYDVSSIPERRGILTHPGALTAISDRDIGGLVARGLFVYEHLLCREAPSPPPDLNLSDFTSHLGPEATERDYSEDRLASEACAGCHQHFDPLAFAFERFDGIGRYTLTDENGQPLQSDGEFVDDGQTLAFETVEDYVGLLATSPTMQRCLTQKHIMFALGIRAEEIDEPSLEAVYEGYKDEGGTYEAMMRAIVGHGSFRRAKVDESNQPEESP